jgi:hypothetical protein
MSPGTKILSEMLPGRALNFGNSDALLPPLGGEDGVAEYSMAEPGLPSSPTPVLSAEGQASA